MAIVSGLAVPPSLAAAYDDTLQRSTPALASGPVVRQRPSDAAVTGPPQPSGASLILQSACIRVARQWYPNASNAQFSATAVQLYELARNRVFPSPPWTPPILPVARIHYTPRPANVQPGQGIRFGTPTRDYAIDDADGASNPWPGALGEGPKKEFRDVSVAILSLTWSIPPDLRAIYGVDPRPPAILDLEYDHDVLADDRGPRFAFNTWWVNVLRDDSQPLALNPFTFARPWHELGFPQDTPPGVAPYFGTIRRALLLDMTYLPAYLDPTPEAIDLMITPSPQFDRYNNCNTRIESRLLLRTSKLYLPIV